MNDLKQETDRLLALAPRMPRYSLAVDGQLVWIADDMATHLRALQAENDRLTAECEALRADAERLDWLEKQNKSTDPCRAMACVTWNIGHDWETRERLRPEIDDAINRERS